MLALLSLASFVLSSLAQSTISNAALEMQNCLDRCLYAPYAGPNFNLSAVFSDPNFNFSPSFQIMEQKSYIINGVEHPFYLSYFISSMSGYYYVHIHRVNVSIWNPKEVRLGACIQAPGRRNRCAGPATCGWNLLNSTSQPKPNQHHFSPIYPNEPHCVWDCVHRDNWPTIAEGPAEIKGGLDYTLATISTSADGNFDVVAFTTKMGRFLSADLLADHYPREKSRKRELFCSQPLPFYPPHNNH